MSDTASDRAVALEGEDVARASWYGLISRLFYGPPDPNLLAEICRAGGGGEPAESAGALVLAWQAVQNACRSTYPPVVRQEYDDLFVGAGKSEVTPYLSGYAEEASDRYFVRLRKHLAAWGLARREGVPEFEDHISGISEVMRWLIENRHSVAEQQRFFEEFAWRGATAFFAAVQKSPTANFYKHVAKLGAAFFEVEKTAFAMGDPG